MVYLFIQPKWIHIKSIDWSKLFRETTASEWTKIIAGESNSGIVFVEGTFLDSPAPKFPNQ